MKHLYLLLLLVFITACGAKKLAVDHADTLISHQVTKRLPLSSKQKSALSKDIDKFLMDQKPVAEEILPVIDAIDISHPDKVETQYSKLEGYYLKLADRFSVLFSRYMARLDKSQQKEFFSNLKDEDKDIMSKDDEDVLESVEENIKKLTGHITKEQKEIVKEFKDYFLKRHQNRIENRRKLHSQFRDIYSGEGNKAELFHEAFLRYQKDSLTGNRNVEFLKKIIPTLSKDQKEHFRKESQEIKDVLSYFISKDY